MGDVSKKSYSSKRTRMQRTIRAHSVKATRKPQLCNFCDKKLANKSNLNRHVMNKHSEEIGAPPLTNVFTCDHCKCFFSNKSSLKRHIENIHLKTTDTKKSISCFQCNQRFNSIRNLNAHLTIGHNVTIKEEKLQFSDLREFFAWKQEEEIRTNSRFIQLRGLRKQRRKGEEISTLKFVCNRSGIFRSKANGKRAYRIKGSSKIGRYCSAYIEITFKENSLVNGDYCSTHSGHNTDLRYLTLTMLEKREIYEKIQKGATFSSILNEIRNNVGKEIKRKHLVTNKDLHNIVTTFKRFSTPTQDHTSAQSSTRANCCTKQSQPVEKNDRQFSNDLDSCADLWVETCQRMVNRFDQNEPHANIFSKDPKSKTTSSSNDIAQRNSHNKTCTISYVNTQDYSFNNQPNIPHQSCYKASNYLTYENQIPEKLDNTTFFDSVVKPSDDIQQVKDFCDVSNHHQLNKDFYSIDMVNIEGGIANNAKVSSGSSAEYVIMNSTHQADDSQAYLRSSNMYDRLPNNVNMMQSQNSYNLYNYTNKLLSASSPESEPPLHCNDDRDHFDDMISDDTIASGDESETSGEGKTKQDVPDLRDKVNSVTALYNIVESELDDRKKNIIRNYVDNMFRVLQYRYNKCKTKKKQDSQDQVTNKEKKLKHELQSTNKKQKRNEIPNVLQAHFSTSSEYVDVPTDPNTTYVNTNSLNDSTIENSTGRDVEFMEWNQC